MRYRRSYRRPHKSRFVEMFGDGSKWPSEVMENLCCLITDGEHATPKRVEKGIFLLSARNVLDHELKLEDVDYIDQEEYDRIAKRIVPQEGDVLLSCSGSVGRCCTVPRDIKFQMVRSVALLRLKETLLPKFVEYLICSPHVQRQIDKLKTASSQANLFQGKIGEDKTTQRFCSAHRSPARVCGVCGEGRQIGVCR